MHKKISKERKPIIESLKEEKLDILIIGGGITGAGISLDATKRGMKTGLIEMQDFAAGTSSRSTKLVHGGLRYLKQLEVGLVAEVGKERAIVYENGPHVTTPEWMMLPFYKGGTFGPVSTNLGLRTYDFLAGVKKSERRKMLKPNVALEKEPLLQPNGLLGAGYYVEYKTDDARLTLEILKKSVEMGTNALNYIKMIEFLYDEKGKVNGIVAEDQITKETFQISANYIVNATGPWVDEIRDLNNSKKGKTLQLTKGVHLVFSQEVFPLHQAIYFDTPDKRMIFAIPRGDKAYIGTTDTKYESDISNPKVLKEDRDYILDAINSMFPSLRIESEDIESSWAGVRPLIAEEGKGPSEISRKDEIFTSESGLISMAGGKLTGYRKMAEQAVDKVASKFKNEEGILFEESTTKNLSISGGEVGGSKGFKDFKTKKIDEGIQYGLSAREAEQLVNQYGSNISTIYQLYSNHKLEAQQEGINQLVLATLLYSIEYEFAYTPLDYFVRRTSSMFFNIEFVREHKQDVVNYMHKKLEWTNQQKLKYEEELEIEYKNSILKNIK